MIGEIARYDSIGQDERDIVQDALNGNRPLSGYLAGQERGGFFVQELEDAWCETFGVKHAVACNSATSGLLAAAFVIGLRAGDSFVCPAMTMSATAAAPMFTGATPIFQDVRDTDFGLQLDVMPDTTKAIFTTNLFGHPSMLACNEWDRTCGIHLIEDNAQSPFAKTPNGRYAGTNGTIGVWSLNVHKHIQCGEGGMITTDIDWIALALREFINHGENGSIRRIGLNLRMPELCAAVALSQLRRGKELVAGRVAQAEAIIAAIGEIPGLRPPVVLPGCTHVYYTIPFLLAGPRRSMFCAALRGQGVPIVEGYVEPLYRLPAFEPYTSRCPVAEDLQDRRLFYFENCAWSPTDAQIKLIGDAFKKAAEEVL